jgi:hypothetical protein
MRVAAARLRDTQNGIKLSDICEVGKPSSGGGVGPSLYQHPGTFKYIFLYPSALEGILDLLPIEDKIQPMKSSFAITISKVKCR